MEFGLSIARFEPSSSDHCSALIRRSILASHQSFYSETEISVLIAEYSAEKLVQKASNRLVFVIRTEEKQILAIGSAKDHKIKAIYVDPNHFGKGLGSAMLAFLESQMSRDGHIFAELFSSLNSEQFYRRAGYDFIRWHNDTNGPAIVMQKKLPTKCLNP